MRSSNYACLSRQIYKNSDFSLVPIRNEDRYKIMKWRNEQIYHLRQKKQLNKEKQDKYFNETISGLFNKKHPPQILFSLLRTNELIGYGGLVHINWKIKTGEISFLMDTSLEEKMFEKIWLKFIGLIEQVAFDVLKFNKIYTYSYNIRPRLNSVLKKANYILEKKIANAKIINKKKIEANIHGKYSNELKIIKLSNLHQRLLFEWANDSVTRKQSIYSKKIDWFDHKKWFNKIMNDLSVRIFIFFCVDPVGMLRLDKIDEGYKISFSVDVNHRGQSIGSKIILYATSNFDHKTLVAEVLSENKISQNIFKNHGFKIKDIYEKNNKEVIKFIRKP